MKQLQNASLRRCLTFMLVLLLAFGMAGCHRQTPETYPASSNTHTIWVNGREYAVMDREYEGEYDIQIICFDTAKPTRESAHTTTVVVRDPDIIPEGFSCQAILSAGEYREFCDAWGLHPAYTDTNQAYAVIAGGESCMDVVLLQLADVVTEDGVVSVFLRDRFHNPSSHSAGFVLTIPVDDSAKELEFIPVCDAKEAANLQQFGTMYDPNIVEAEKPVLYLYPEEETEVHIRLDYAGELTCSYPAYQDGWTVTAAPDGTLRDAQGQTYSYLYWEGQADTTYDFSQGFCVRGEDSAAFLEQALASLGLNRREANEFVVYWLPRLERNPWNLISFQGAAYTDAARLEIDPAPDTVLRVFMAWRPLQEPVEIAPQRLTAPQRNGFTVVEWGGTELN